MAGLQIVRVKRKINEPCTESIFLSSKRRKGADDEKDEQLVKETFLFLRTSNKEDGELSGVVKKALDKRRAITDECDSYRADPVCKRARQSSRRRSELQRLKIISDRRGSSDDTGVGNVVGGSGCTADDDGKRSVSASVSDVVSVQPTSSEANDIIILDVEKEPVARLPPNTGSRDVLTCNGVPMSAASASSDSSELEMQYVYDIYYTQSSAIDFRDFKQDLIVECLADENVMWAALSDDDDVDDLYEDDDDENAEDNWRNDYPDEDAMYAFTEVDAQSDDEFYSSHVPDLFGDRLKIRDSDDELSSDSDEAASSSNPSSRQYWTPQTSYERYKKKMMNQPSDEDDDVDL